MRTLAMTSGEMLEVVLLHLHRTGWQQVDIDKLVTVYMQFAWSTNRCVYGGTLAAPNPQAIKAGIEQDIADLVAKGLAVRTVSRVWLTDDGRAQAALLKLEKAPFGSLIPTASSTFPRRA